MTVSPPENITARLSDQMLVCSWSEEDRFEFPFRVLRGLCPCANCVNEFTGERTFFVDDAPEDIQPGKMELVGNYAVKIYWSDGHSTGLYTWKYLRSIQVEMDRQAEQQQH
ncbi:DUF971 domain-containing protein [Rubinisphaera margarita]|uniref:DUF971 domain-containing protein n=1 Tax=Rubinisphaera margarita TaxID=2909586 RepID=UPI001EE7C16A|nr:DUF971 domain-containing protein [Rubinisphaera margarita]MCG6154695.1 DUF971 domain-containing protein [Rubinisphaera margarita]